MIIIGTTQNFTSSSTLNTKNTTSLWSTRDHFSSRATNENIPGSIIAPLLPATTESTGNINGTNTYVEPSSSLNAHPSITYINKPTSSRFHSSMHQKTETSRNVNLDAVSRTISDKTLTVDIVSVKKSQSGTSFNIIQYFHARFKPAVQWKLMKEQDL